MIMFSQNAVFPAIVWIILAFLAGVSVVLSASAEWSEWSEWEPCSVSCGEGIKRRHRACDIPPRNFDGKWCNGKRREITPCEAAFACPFDGNWGEWSTWTACSASCGEGVMNRFRECDSPPPSNGGRDCEGESADTMACFALKECPRDGKWSSWSEWSPCSVTCGSDGSSFRYRSCNNPPPLADGKDCSGSSQGSRRCRADRACAVNGQWTEWSEWTGCSVTCGSGIRTRLRRCDNPPPQNGGLDCNREEAGEMQERSCNGSIVFCPVQGGWSDWSDWGNCTSRDCLKSDILPMRLRGRTCSSPHPEHEGLMCQGRFLDAAACEGPTNCAVDGGWSRWSEWTCTPFVAIRQRVCNNPAPSNGGKPCKGKDVENYLSDTDIYMEACPDFEAAQPENVRGDDEDFAGSGFGSGDNAD